MSNKRPRDVREEEQDEGGRFIVCLFRNRSSFFLPYDCARTVEVHSSVEAKLKGLFELEQH